MPAFTLQAEPGYFDADIRQKGIQWLADHPGHVGRPRAFWTIKRECRQDLRRAFRSLCGYTLMHEMRGTVDHYVSWKNASAQAYEWDNYRFANGIVNSSKQTADGAVWDPFQIEFDWFEIHLPSMIMRVSNLAPPAQVQLLQFTLDRLPITDEDEVIDFRAALYDDLKHGNATLAQIDRLAPVLAASIRRFQATNPPGTPLP
jgi:hypothetical protein